MTGEWLGIPATICVVGAAASLFWVGWPPEVPRTLQYEGKAYKATCDYTKKTVKLQVRDLSTNQVEEREYTREQVSLWRVKP